MLIFPTVEKEKRDTVNKKYSNKISTLKRKLIRECIGQEFTIMGFIFKQYDDGLRVLLVTDEGYLIRIPKWFSGGIVYCSDAVLENVYKSGNYKIANIKKYRIPGSNKDYHTYVFDIVDKRTGKIFEPEIDLSEVEDGEDAVL